MAIIPGQQKGDFSSIDPRQEKQKKLLYLFAGVLIIISAVIYFGFFRKTAPSSSSNQINNPAVLQAGKELEGLKDVNLDLPDLKDKKFQSLVLPGQFPISIGEKGRQNPFAPF